MTGQVYFEDPGFFLFGVSFLFRSLFYRMLMLDWKYDLGLLDAADSLVGPLKKDLPELTRQGLEVLQTALDRVFNEHPNTRVFGFAVDDEYDRENKEIFEGAGAGYFAEVSRYVAEDTQRTNCLPLDDHWNHRGNEVAGRLLNEKFSLALSSSLDSRAIRNRIRLPEDPLSPKN